jgi:hypothetical protein
MARRYPLTEGKALPSMTEKKERIKSIKIARQAFEKRFGRITRKDVTLLENGFDGERIDYVLFRNDFTGREYRVDFDARQYEYVIYETDC